MGLMSPIWDGWENGPLAQWAWSSSYRSMSIDSQEHRIVTADGETIVPFCHPSHLPHPSHIGPIRPIPPLFTELSATRKRRAKAMASCQDLVPFHPVESSKLAQPVAFWRPESYSVFPDRRPLRRIVWRSRLTFPLLRRCACSCLPGSRTWWLQPKQTERLPPRPLGPAQLTRVL